MSDTMWQKIQAGLGYSNGEMAKILADPYRKSVLAAGPLMVRRKIIAEIIEARNCAVHKAGARYFIRANGAIRIDDQAPGSQMCIALLATLAPTCQVILDRYAQGQDPKGEFTYWVHCPDTGVECGGFGTVLAKVTVE